MAALVGRTVKLSRSGRQMKGCCPFHAEKTPSFYVYDDSYHCFGCGAHGDAIAFVMQTSRAGFVEAVQSLAGEAGLDMPRAGPGAEAAERQRQDLHGVLDAAQRHYAEALRTPDGSAALAYLRNRGLTNATVARFGLGWAGDGRGTLAASLAKAGIDQAQLLEAGLLRAGEDGAIRGELFFNRVMFPIRDRTGRMISFGGRTLGDGQPKYLNGPDSPVFSKRRTLYGLDLARTAARGGAEPVAVEGYMDVIALHQAGFEAAVAPLGTALTTEQLGELWRLSPSPVVCFDGDAAGARAAARAAHTALAVLAPDRTIKLATLPQGEDPDTLARRDPAAMAAILASAEPLWSALYGIIRGTGGEATPHERTLLLRRLDAAAASIPDKALAREYRQALRQRYFEAASKRRTEWVPGGKAARQVRLPPRPDLSGDRGGAASSVSRARALAAILINHPDLMRDVEEAYGSLVLPPDLARLRSAILACFSQEDALDSTTLLDHLHTLGLSQDVADVLKDLPSCGHPDVQPAEAEAGWWHFYGLMHRGGLEQAKKAAERHVVENGDDAAAWARLDALSAASFRLSQGKQSDTDQEAEAEAYDL